MKIKFDDEGNQVEEAMDKKGGKCCHGRATGLLFLLIVLLVAGLGFVSYRYYQVNQKYKAVTDPKAQEAMNKQAVADAVSKVKRHMLLPTDEQPNLATISDASALAKEQAFYQGSQNGDIVLLYMKAKKAVIYSPSRDVVVNAGPIYVNENAAAPATTKK